MTVVLQTFTILAVSAGAFFFMAGTVGLLRFPDTLTRLHALTKADNLGLGCIVLGLLPHVDRPLGALKLLSVWLLVQLSGAVVTQLVGQMVRQEESPKMMIAFEIAFVLLVLAIAAWTILARETFTAVVIFIVYGLLLSLAWVRLSAVDVALTEVAIGSGVTGLLLLTAAARVHTKDDAVPPPSVALRTGAAMLCALVSAGLALIVLQPADPAPTLAWEARENLAKTGLDNPVAGVLFAYRALDTLLEKVVLLLALVGVWSLARDQAWGGVPGLRPQKPENATLNLLALVLPPLGIIFGIYMAWVGASQPGGAFQGGALLAAMWLLVMIAGVRRAPSIGRPWLRSLLVVGPAVFIAIGFAGFAVADGFLSYPTGYAKPLIILAEAALTLSIAVTLALLTAGPPEQEQ